MYKKLVYLVMTFLILLSLTFCPPVMKTVRADPAEIIVHQGESIQDAIDNASAGDTIRVEAGIYYENLFINKSVKLVGENPLNTIIDGYEAGNVVHIDSPNVSIINFTIQNGGEVGGFGVQLTESAVNVTIRNNIIKNNTHGLKLLTSTNNSIIENEIIENDYRGIEITDNSKNNNIIGNTIANNSKGVYIDSSPNNTFYHNNFIDNTDQEEILDSFGTVWDNGAEGNYWSDYSGVDADGDGIGDTSYHDSWWPTLDKYPLIDPWSLTRVIDVYQNKEHHYITVYCNATVGWRKGNVPFFFNQPRKQIIFNVTGPSNTNGFCNITIPKKLLNATPTSKWRVFLDGNNITGTVNISENVTYTSLHFTYTHSTHKVQVIGTEAISNLSPTADFTYSPLNNNLINFTDTSTDPDGTIIKWYWDFGDGNNSTKQNPTHEYGEKRFYTVDLTVTDNVQASNTISKTVIVGKINLTLNIPSTATVKETIIATAILKDEGDNPIPSENIDFYARTDGAWNKFNSTSTNATGVASAAYTPAIWGEHQITANYNGSAAHIKNNSTRTIMVDPLVARLTIDAVDPLKVTQGKPITIKAILKDENGDPIQNETIEFYLFKGGIWESIGSSETDSDGVAVFKYTPSAAGTFHIRAEFPGTQIYSRTFSDEIELNVSFDYTPYILVGVAAIAAIALIAFAMWRKRKKHLKSEHSQE